MNESARQGSPICPVCSRTVRHGESVIQVDRGNWDGTGITPNYTDRLVAVHGSCVLRDGVRLNVTPPFTCTSCGRKIASGEELIYAVEGRQPDIGYIRAESRTILFVAHPFCWNRSVTAAKQSAR